MAVDGLYGRSYYTLSLASINLARVQFGGAPLEQLKPGNVRDCNSCCVAVSLWDVVPGIMVRYWSVSVPARFGPGLAQAWGTSYRRINRTHSHVVLPGHMRRLVSEIDFGHAPELDFAEVHGRAM